MLDTNTKRRIDTCRDILVGKVPDPKSQVEQITIALIYKFMDDMDAEAEEMGGKRSFFTGEFARYGWSKLMAPGMGGFDILSLYSEAIGKMNENSGIPALFRDIFKNAYLPYRDPETLRIFLKEINTFTYDHSERLGDAFEYLLSVLGSQGEAGQFRTPRHIIDFMVEIVDPKKDETILDPACGTAGFLISSYKHILKHNTKSYQEQQDREAYDEKNVPVELLTLDSPLHYSGDLLTPDDRTGIATNINGYDISPDMVRLSLVNMYLHGFTDPHIEEYDTLTSDEKWNELADVVLANPPFMSPKGGIKPHKRFSVQSKRSEVLFVDYIAEHLTPNGRAAVVVPEGIIFQSQTAYKQLREMLVKNYLVAVISLPAGVFNPYSGVKTSILVMDKRLARKSDEILFVKIDNDGFNLGAQRRPIDKNDLPAAVETLKAFCVSREDGIPDDFDVTRHRNVLVVSREQIGESGEWNLSGEMYQDESAVSTEWPLVELKEFATLYNGRAYKREELLDEGPTPVIRVGNFFSNREWYYSDLDLDESKYCEEGDLLYAWSASFGARIWDGPRAIYHYHIWKIETSDKIDKKFLYYLLARDSEKIKSEGNGIAMSHATKGGMEKRKFPLPPLEVQKEIVAEIDGYQKVIDGAHQVVRNYQPRISIHPDWPIVEFSEGPFKIIDGDRGANYPKKEDFSPTGFCIFLNTKNVRPDGFVFDKLEFVSKEKDEQLRKGKLQRGDVVLTTRGTVGNTGYFSADVPFENIRINSGMLIFRPDSDKLTGEYLFNYFQSENFKQQVKQIISGAAQPQLPIRSLNTAKIPLPPIEEQLAIVAEIEEEQQLVNANKELIRRFEEKIKATINRVWGEAE